MISKQYLKSDKSFSPYEDIKIDNYSLDLIKEFPSEIMSKLFLIAEAELWKKILKGKISPEEARWAISFAQYLKSYFNI